MSKHVVFDLETLGRSPDCMILQVAAVAFNPEVGGDIHSVTLNQYVNLESQTGRRADASTLSWWLRQDEAARLRLIEGLKEATPLDFVMSAVGHWFHRHSPVSKVWARGTDFDLGILRHALAGEGMKEPWKYNSARDTRTLFECAGGKPELKARIGVAHDALSDCVNEARLIQGALARLKQ